MKLQLPFRSISPPLSLPSLTATKRPRFDPSSSALRSPIALISCNADELKVEFGFWGFGLNNKVLQSAINTVNLLFSKVVFMLLLLGFCFSVMCCCNVRFIVVLFFRSTAFVLQFMTCFAYNVERML